MVKDSSSFMKFNTGQCGSRAPKGFRFFCLAALVMCGARVSAHNSPDYHARHNAQSPYYVGPRGEIGEKQTTQPIGYWQKTWGAIATDGARGLLGVVVGADSEVEAKRLALRDCEAKGGDCKVEIAYFNQCAALVTGDKLFNVSNAHSIARASELGLELCREEKDTNCRVYYSACSEPIFHNL